MKLKRSYFPSSFWVEPNTFAVRDESHLKLHCRDNLPHTRDPLISGSICLCDVSCGSSCLTTSYFLFFLYSSGYRMWLQACDIDFAVCCHERCYTMSLYKCAICNISIVTVACHCCWVLSSNRCLRHCRENKI